MRTFFLLLTGSLTLVASENPQELVRKAIENYQRDAQSALRFTYTTTENSPKGSEVTRMTPLDGTPFERLISRNGKPLTAEEERQQEAKYEAAAKKRGSETPEERAKRIAKFRDQSKFLLDVPDAFQFTMLPDETVNGRANYVIQCTPKPDYHARNTKSRMFSKLTAKIWIDKEDLRMTKADAAIVDSLSIGWIMARISKGGRIELTQTRVADDVWLPKRIDINGEARILLVNDKKIDEQIIYGGFKPISSRHAKELAQTASR